MPPIRDKIAAITAGRKTYAAALGFAALAAAAAAAGDYAKAAELALAALAAAGIRAKLADVPPAA